MYKYIHSTFKNFGEKKNNNWTEKRLYFEEFLLFVFFKKYIFFSHYGQWSDIYT